MRYEDPHLADVPAIEEHREAIAVGDRVDPSIVDMIAAQQLANAGYGPDGEPYDAVEAPEPPEVELEKMGRAVLELLITSSGDSVEIPCPACGSAIQRQNVRRHVARHGIIVPEMAPSDRARRKALGLERQRGPGKGKKKSTPNPPSPNKADQVDPDKIFTSVIRSVCGDTISVAHLPAVIDFRQAVVTLIKKVGTP